MGSPLPPALAGFLDTHADSLDQDAAHADELLSALASSGLLRRGVPQALGGDGSTTAEAVQAIASVAEHSLAAAFVLWGHRTSIEYLLQSPNTPLRERWLPRLLAGQTAGATGLSNAMKFLSGIESLQVQGTPLKTPGEHAHHELNGQVPWATNLRPRGFLLSVAVERRDGGAPFVVALPAERAGLQRSNDLDLIALRGTRTAAVKLQRVAVDEGDLLTPDARQWLPRVRPAFLSLQCGLAIGLARAALRAARAQGTRGVLDEPVARTEDALQRATQALLHGLGDARYVAQPVLLFERRIELTELALRAVQQELQASGGRAYHRDQPLGFARRWREAAFLPIVTPSLTQLQGELIRHRERAAGAALA